jgi:hypothetical protein
MQKSKRCVSTPQLVLPYSHKILQNRGLTPHFSDIQGPCIIYTVAEVAYCLIANKKGITSLVGLKGNMLGSFPSTLAAYFVEELLASAGLKPTDYAVVSACAQLHREGQAHSRMLQRGND